MTPKEKAKELIQRYISIRRDINLSDAKQCALIAVDEILDAIKNFHYGLEYLNQRDFWEEVKQEIENVLTK